jgi:transposase
VNVYACDISKDSNDVFNLGSWSKFQNKPAGIKTWLKTVPKDAVIALESTGGYGLALAELAYKAGHTVYVLAPRQVAAYRRSLGRRVKSDKLDAKLIAEFVESNHSRLHPFEPWEEPWKTLRNLVRLRTRLAKDRARIALRMKAFDCSDRDIVKTTKGIKDKMLELDKQIRKQLDSLPESKALMSTKGIGPLTAAAAIAVFKQVPFKDKDAFVAYTGLDLRFSDSGTKKGNRVISSQGDVTLRQLLYLAGKAASATADWQPYVQELEKRRYAPIQIHCAVARKLARILFGIYNSGQSFDETKAFKTKAQVSAPHMLASQA